MIEILMRVLSQHIKDHSQRNRSPSRVVVSYNTDINGHSWITVAYPLRPRGTKQITWHQVTNYSDGSSLEDLLNEAHRNQLRK